MDENSEINQELGLEKIEVEDETQLYHKTDPLLINPPDTQISDVGFQGINGFLNIVYDPDTDPGEQEDDPDIDISLINGILHINFVEPDPPQPSDKAKWIKHILNSIRTSNYRVFYSKSSDNRTLPFDTCRGFLIWDFEKEFLHFISLNKVQQRVNIKYPISIDTIGFEDIYCIEGYHNLVDDDKV